MDKMKSRFWLTAIAGLFAGLPAGQALAQDGPLASPAAMVQQVVGLHPITIKYHSPGVKGRTIWGDLQPYGEVWRAGANAKTTIEFGETVRIGGTVIEAGRYGFQLIPRETEWDLIFSNTPDGNGQEHNADEDVARITIQPKEAPFRERLAYSFDNMTNNSCAIALHWEKLKGEFEVKLGTGIPEFSGVAKDVFSTIQKGLESIAATNIEEALEVYSDDFATAAGQSKTEYREFLLGAKEQGMFDGMKVTYENVKVEVDGDKATANGFDLSGAFGELKIDFELEKRDGKWMLTFSAQY